MLSTAIYLPQYNSGLQRVRGQALWHEVGRGLQVAVLGDLALVALSAPGLLLAWLAVHGGRALQLQVGIDDADGALHAGLVLVGAAAALGSGLNLLGRWLCLVNAPPRPGVKERLFASILCSLGGLALLFTAHFLGGARNYAVLQRRLRRAQRPRVLPGQRPAPVGRLAHAVLQLRAVQPLPAEHRPPLPGHAAGRQRQALLPAGLLHARRHGRGAAVPAPARLAGGHPAGGLRRLDGLLPVAPLPDGRRPPAPGGRPRQARAPAAGAAAVADDRPQDSGLRRAFAPQPAR